MNYCTPAIGGIAALYMGAGAAGTPGNNIGTLAIDGKAGPCIVIGARVPGGKTVPGASIGAPILALWKGAAHLQWGPEVSPPACFFDPGILEGFRQLPQVVGDQPWHVWQGLETSNWHVPLHTGSERPSGSHQMMDKPDSNYDAVFPWFLQIKVNKAYRPNAHLLDTLMHYKINII